MNMQNPLENLKEGNQMLPVIVSVDEPKNAPGNALWFRPIDKDLLDFGPVVPLPFYFIYKRTGGNSLTAMGGTAEGFQGPSESSNLVTAVIGLAGDLSKEKLINLYKKTGWALVGVFDPFNTWGLVNS